MTARHLLWIFCDHLDPAGVKDCPARFGSAAVTVGHARTLARQHGWIMVGRADYCQHHHPDKETK